ncbi:MAG: hypothetical protein AB8H86_31485 [Polyangiales bacterium]
MLRFVWVFCLVACSDGFVVGDGDSGPDASTDAATDAARDAGPLVDAAALDAVMRDAAMDASADAGRDASADAGGPFVDPDCAAPWLVFADPERAAVRRISLTDGSECPELDGGGALDEEVTSVTLAADVLVVGSPSQVQGLDLRSNTVVWSIAQDDPVLESRTVVVALNEGFIAAWVEGGELVYPTRVLDPLVEGTRLPIDQYFYDLSAAEDGESFWGARSPGGRARRDLSGVEVETLQAVIELERIHSFGRRVVATEGRSNVLYIDDLDAAPDTAPEQFNPDDCDWIPFALVSPMNDEDIIVSCTAIGAPRGRVSSFRVMDSTGATRPLLVLNSVVWDAEIYAP